MLPGEFAQQLAQSLRMLDRELMVEVHDTRTCIVFSMRWLALIQTALLLGAEPRANLSKQG